MSRVGDFVHQFFIGNVAEITGEISAGMVNLTVMNPPYDSLRGCEGRQLDARDMLKGLYRAVKSGGGVVWVVGDKIKTGIKSLTSLGRAFIERDAGAYDHAAVKY